MDLVTLVTACALSVDPKLMHALIWHQSGGEPWAVSVQGESLPRVYPSMRDAISEARNLSGIAVRVGLAGLIADPSKVTAAMFLPCRNVSLAARRIAILTTRCRAHPALKADPTLCSVAVYRGSWGEPDSKFAEAVMASVASGEAPNFDMPKNTSMEFLDVASDAPPPFDATSPESAKPFDDRERGWSSALFPARELQRGVPASSTANDDRRTEDAQSHRASDGSVAASKSPLGSPFVATSAERKPQ